MTTHIGIGFSQELNAEKAAREAAYQAKSNIKADHIDMALILSTVHYPPNKTMPVINQMLQTKNIIGSSTAGIILTDYIKTLGVAILALASDDIQFGTGSVNDISSKDPHQAGTALAHSTVKNFGKLNKQAFLFFIDGQFGKKTPFLKGLQDILGNFFPIVGAGSSDDFNFEQSFQIYQGDALVQSAVGLLMGGRVTVGIGSRHGWRPLGKPRVIDEVNDNIIVSIDEKKASSIYVEYFGKDADHIRSSKLGQLAILYPLGIYVGGGKEYLLRNAIDILADGSIVCQGDVPNNAEVHIMIGNKESCKQAAVDAAQEAYKNLGGKHPKLIIILESMTRLKLLGRQAIQEIEKIKEMFGPSVPIFGMYADGEIYPFQTIDQFKKPHLQNESITILAIS